MNERPGDDAWQDRVISRDGSALFAFSANVIDQDDDHVAFVFVRQTRGGAFALEEGPCRVPMVERTTNGTGRFDGRLSQLAEGSLELQWNEHFIRLDGGTTVNAFDVRVHLGCDPATKTSFELVQIAPGEAVMECWREGAFVSCDGVSFRPGVD